MNALCLIAHILICMISPPAPLSPAGGYYFEERHAYVCVSSLLLCVCPSLKMVQFQVQTTMFQFQVGCLCLAMQIFVIGTSG